MIVAKNLCYRYPDKTLALSGISFSIEPGEFVGLIGTNGAGKTTLFKCMTGLAKKYQGELSSAGIEVNSSNLNRLYKKVGYVFQNSDDQLFMPTVYDEVAYGPNNLGMSESKAKKTVSEALLSVGMEGSEERGIHTLSAGQKKRIALAGVLAMSPDVLLLDEPVAGLDPAGVHQIMSLLKELNKTKKLTIVMATHNVNLLPIFMDRAIVITEGKIVCEGTPEEVFSDASSLEIASLKLPEIAQLMKELKKEHMLPWENIPLTIAEAKEVLKHPIKSYYTK